MRELTREESEAILEEQGFGMLALSTDGQPYALPMSFGFDGTDLFFQMNATGRKNEIIAENPATSILFVRIDPAAGTSRSVIVEGRIERVPEEATSRAFEALADNASFGTDLQVWGIPVEEADLRLYRVDVDSISGRIFGADT
ncbi:MAG: pyridoxamine 5'-phosphate oxidase family protein [Halodesulfurarchaeum sp.]